MSEFSVLLAGHDVDPLVLQQAAQDNDNEPVDLDSVGAWLVQLHAQPSSAQRQDLRARHRLLLSEYIPQRAYLERLSFRQVRLVQGDPLVRAVSEFEPRFKVSPLLANLDTLDDDGELLVDVSVFADSDVDAMVERLADLGLETRVVLDDRTSGGRAIVRVVLQESEQARRIARLPNVRWLEPFPEIVDDGPADAVLDADAIPTVVGHGIVSYAWEHGLNGEGQLVGILDNGLPDLRHCFFADPGAASVGPGHRKVEATRDATGTPLGTHATFTAGCLTGDSWRTPGTAAWRGAAWAARLVAGNRRDLATNSLLGELKTAASHGATIHSNSWHSKPQGSGGLSIYDGQAGDVDAFMFFDEDQLVVGSSGNTGEEQGSPGNAKNALCVGSSRRTGATLGDGANGPSGDGRRKPDLMAVGCGVESAILATSCDVGPKEPCASSYATPIAAGAAALVRQYLMTGRCPETARAEPDAAAPTVPTGALLKALLIGSAVVPGALPTDLADPRGWGSLDLRRILDFGEGSRRLLLHDVRHTHGLGADQTWERDLVVLATQPLVVVLTWSDPPGAAGADPVVNNLDLVVTDPEGNHYLGNVILAGRSVTGGESDRRNNVEVVVVDAPSSGRWRVRVHAERISVRPLQGYAVVITGAAAWLPLLPPMVLTTQGDMCNIAPVTSPEHSWTGSRFRIWMSVGVAAVMAILLRDVDRLLQSIEGTGGRGYGTGVLTGFDPTLEALKPGDIKAALDLWLGDDSFGALRLLRWFFIGDFMYIAAYTWLIAQLLRFVDAKRSFTRWAVGAVLFFDLTETALSWIIVECNIRASLAIGTIRFLSLAKWLALATSFTVAIVLRRKQVLARGATHMAQARRGGTQSSGVALFGQSVLVVIFVLLVALPAGGALEQLPDVVRYNLDGAPTLVRLLNPAALLLLVCAVTASGLVGARSSTSPPAVVRTCTVSGVALAISAVSVALGFWFDDRFNVSALAPVLLVLVLVVAAWVTSKASDFAGTNVSDEKPTEGPSTLDDNARWRIGALAGAITVAIGLGIVRAASPFLLLDEGDATSWWKWGALGLAVAALGGASIEHIVYRVGGYRAESGANGGGRDRLRIGIVIIFSISTVLALLIAVWPEGARHFGATGALAIAFSLFSTVIAVLQWVSRRGRRWPVATALGLGARTPWAGILIAIWALASVLNSSGGYHDIRTQPVGNDAVGKAKEEYLYKDINAAFEQWALAQDDTEACPLGDTGTVPLVMVAAPGGGIRAAYWTATALENLFPDECARRRIFAISGASGGSVGTVMWQAAIDSDTSPTTAVRAISGDEALSATITGMLLRDLPQPITGITSRWRDRAALLEDGWVEHSKVFGEDDALIAWNAVGAGSAGEGWAPVLVLNSSSATDGCRILVTNAGSMPTSTTADCLSTDRGPHAGTSRAALDPLASLADGSDENCGDRQPAAVTAALLSARFPYVTPSGAIHYCNATNNKDVRVTYAVDGGYFENSGILTLLEILEAIEGKLAKPTNAGMRVEPWIIVVDNHYRSNANVAVPTRPYELFVPLITFTGSQLESQTALEQAAASELSGHGCERFGRIGPAVSAGHTAPLGWVLSKDSRESLDKALRRALESIIGLPPKVDRHPQRNCLAPLLRFLGSTVPAEGD